MTIFPEVSTESSEVSGISDSEGVRTGGDQVFKHSADFAFIESRVLYSIRMHQECQALDSRLAFLRVEEDIGVQFRLWLKRE